VLRAGVALLAGAPAFAGGRSARWIGYTELRTDRPGGRHANIATMRACMIRMDGSGRRLLAPSLTQEPDSWTQFSGWSPDGRMAIIGRGWERPSNAAWEEEHREFRFNEDWLYDMFLLDVRSGKLANMTAIERVSGYNTGLFFWPGDPKSLGFQALIGGNSHPFRMDADGTHKRDLTAGSQEFAYGFGASPDGGRIAYHKNYRIFIADGDGSNAKPVETGQPFNFSPQWSPDGQWIVFVSGEHYNCHPYAVRRDGSGLRKIGDRQGYSGVTPFLDVPDFHGGSSDVPVWSPDGKWIYYTAQFGRSVELMRGSLEGAIERLTHSPEETFYYHPHPLEEGASVLAGCRTEGVRQFAIVPIGDGGPRAVTHMRHGHAALWPWVRP
jgi:Tol biopolymer transport system component